MIIIITIIVIIIIYLWDFNTRMGNIIEHRKPDMIIIDKASKKAQTVDFTVPADPASKLPKKGKLKIIMT